MTTDTTEAIFDFSEAQKELSDKRSEKARKKQEKDDATYIRHRSKILAKSKEKTKAGRPENRMVNNWQHNFEALPLEEQQRIDDLNLDCRVAQQMAIDVIAGKNTIPPDEVYRMVADFVAATGRGDSFSDLSLLAVLDAGTFDDATADDLNIRQYGRPTKLNGLIFDVFSSACWNWCRANRTVCNPLVYAELAAKFPEPEQQPAPAQIIGLKMASKSEETAREITQQFIKTQQQIGGIQL